MNIFVYGTLMTGFKNNYLLSNCQLLGFGETKEKFGLYSSKCGNFPFVIESIKNETIKGELYKMDEYTLEQLDILEGYPNLYIRKEVIIKLDGKLKKAIMYIKNESTYPDSIDYNQKLDFWE